MKKNGLLTFVFACIPGAGQMYYGYMMRGLSLISLFCLFFALGTMVGPMLMLAPIIWMYSFFDTYDLIRNLASGCPKPDGLLLLGSADELKNFFPKHNKLLGWGLIALGIWALYDSFVRPILTSLLESIGMENAWYVMSQIPSVFVALALVAVGLWLLGLHPGKRQLPPPDDFPPYPGSDDER